MVDIIRYISINELCEKESIDVSVIVEVVDYGVAKPSGGINFSEWIFDLENAYWIKKAVKLNRQLLIDWVAVGMVIDLMKENKKLVKENSRLEGRLSRLS
jgi:chaperone modulatory protein CbpM